jgi:hypothetical protein
MLVCSSTPLATVKAAGVSFAEEGMLCWLVRFCQAPRHVNHIEMRDAETKDPLQSNPGSLIHRAL